MYGMIHKAARSYAIEQLGEAFWDVFARQHGLTDADFVIGERYSDDVTLGMVVALAETMKTPLEDFLEAFGRHWIAFARGGAYANLMVVGGADLPSFLGNLNRMHDGLAAAMPGSRMPQFFVLDDTPQTLRLRYVSERQGLEPFVVGLLQGLCAMFAVAADVTHAPQVGTGVFEIRYQLSIAAE